MDSTNVFSEFTDEYTSDPAIAYIGAFIIGNKYYCAKWAVMGPELVCTYEDGKFVPVGNDSALKYTEITDFRNCVEDIDINKALEKMISPKEAANK